MPILNYTAIMKSSKHLLSITAKKTDDFSQWYQQIVTKANMIAYTDISGCYVLLPNLSKYLSCFHQK